MRYMASPISMTTSATKGNTNMGDDKSAKKRPRDILASLDAAFASSSASSKAPSKYTAQAAQQTSAAAAQQAYQHKKKKKNQPNQQQQKPKAPAAAANSTAGAAKTQQQAKEKEPYDPLYGRLDVDTLQVGLKNCSLHAKAPSLRKANALHATLREYVGSFARDGSAMTDKLKNKVLQFDNPVRTTDAAKHRAANEAHAQSAKLLSARQRRKLGMHMVQADAIEYSEAEKLCEIWRRYARDVIGSDFVGDQSDVAARTARLQAKLRTIDLSGCPIEVIKARNPVNVGVVGIIVADKTQVIQVCVPGSSKVITLPKHELRVRVPFDNQKSFFMDGRWLLGRRAT